MARKNYGTEYQKNRATLLEGNPLCAWCGNAKATQADHIIPVANGGTDRLENLTPSCAKCNHARGATTKNQLHKAKMAARKAATNTNGQHIHFFGNETLTPSTHSNILRNIILGFVSCKIIPVKSIGKQTTTI